MRRIALATLLISSLMLGCSDTDDGSGPPPSGDSAAGDTMAGDTVGGDTGGGDTGGGDGSLVGTPCSSKSSCGGLHCAIDGTCQALTLTYDGAAQQVYQTYCTPCHMSPAPCSGGTAATGENTCWDVYTNLMGTPDLAFCSADSTQAECTVRRINAGQMPASGSIPPRAVEILEDWVAAGAPEN